jgi:hypothetical protein
LATQSVTRFGYVIGQPQRHIRGHTIRKKDTKAGSNKYTKVYVPGHPHANRRGEIYEHVLIAERALGKPLPPQCVVHHVDERKDNNRNDNLVICQDIAYHILLHQRMRAYKASGHADWKKCPYCKQYDDPNNLCNAQGRIVTYHLACARRYDREHYRAERAAIREEAA